MKAKQITVEIIGYLFMLLFIYTAVDKWLTFSFFKKAMHAQIFSPWFADFIIWTLPSLEIAIAVLLMFKKTKLLGLYSAGGLMAAFTIYVAVVYSKIYGKQPCTCGGIFEHMTWAEHLWFNIILTSLAILGIVLFRKMNQSIEPNKLLKANVV